MVEHDTVPEWKSLVPDCRVEYTMPSSTISGMTVRSISVEHTGVVEKFVKYVSKYKYTVNIDYQLGVRKEPTLKGLLDETQQEMDIETNELLTQSNPKETVQIQSDIESNHDDNAQNQDEPVFGDLLGLGTDFECFNTIGNSDQNQSNIINYLD